MKLLPAPRFHIMTPGEKLKSQRKLNADKRLSDAAIAYKIAENSLWWAKETVAALHDLEYSKW